MSYMKLRDDFPEHRKVIGLSDGAFRLHVTALCYATRNLTDGIVPLAAISRLGGTQRRVAELVEAGLWEAPANFEGYAIHDYLGHQRSREQVEAQMEETRKRVRRHRVTPEKRASNGVTSSVVTPDVTRQRETEKHRNRETEAAASAAALPPPPDDAHSRCYRAWQNQSPSGLNRYVLDGIDGLLDDGIAPELFEDACRRAGEAGGNKGWRYVSSIVQRLQSGVPEKARINGTDGTSFVSGLDIVPNTGLRLVSEDEL